ncbi:hypothetical protein Tco_0797356 [Tanacetum coccineum]
MDDPNMTMEEYIKLEEEKARRRGRVFNWQTATYGKIRIDDDLHDLSSVEAEFPAIVINDAFAPQDALHVSFDLGRYYKDGNSAVMLRRPRHEADDDMGGDDEVELTDEESNDEDEIAEVFRINTNIFDYETPLCSVFNEFNYLLKVDLDLLTKDIMGFKTYDDYKNDWIYERRTWTYTGAMIKYR